ncbi:MAG: TIGR02301 family protein [Beijerinckiaceae bacterium]|jgi:uncharacterized protein (TIGR02301 family)|nr:TIGR02301 family protein [Beijerinckiaceae bacterium]
MKRRALALLLVALLPVPAMAQQQPAPQTQRRAAPPPQPPKEPVRPTLPAEYEKPMLELSETLGSLAFLTTLCRPEERPNPWQKRMETLVESEGNAQGNRERLMGAYNAGFSSFSTTYRQCTDAARAARSILVREASRLARALEQRYGG